jgi:hypothetical protein
MLFDESGKILIRQILQRITQLKAFWQSRVHESGRAGEKTTTLLDSAAGLLQEFFEVMTSTIL